MRKINHLLASIVILCSACAVHAVKPEQKELPPVQTVNYVDLERYLGKWYEVASFPQSFAKDCVASTAEYSLKEDGTIRVLNSCRNKTFDGKLRQYTGSAWVVDKETNAKLKVQFFWPFTGDYWVIDLAQDYSYAVVGHPTRDYLWILSRTPQMDNYVYDGILRRVDAQGFDLGRLQVTPQPQP